MSESQKTRRLDKYDLLAVDTGAGHALFSKGKMLYQTKMPWPDVGFALSIFGLKYAEVTSREYKRWMEKP